MDGVPMHEEALADEKVDTAAARLAELKDNLQSVIHGKSEVVDDLIIALIANGSVLMDDVPGVGKTTLAKTLARSIDAEFHRVQFTPDLLPSDILGTSIYNPRDGSFSFRTGPIFCNVLLADEINRASPRTQSALLEAMSEAQVTVEGERRELPNPFIVLATENPVEFHGTYPLPEAQLDRFMMMINLGYPDPETEVDILFDQALSHPIDRVRPVIATADICSIQSLVRQVHVDRSVGEYMVRLVNESRGEARLRLGISPRGTLMLFRACQAAAFLDGRAYVLPDDVQRMAPRVLAHRLILNSKAKYDGTTKDHIVGQILDRTAVPT